VATSFNSFAVGDVAVFERCFSAEDFVAFSRLSGDGNPLHHDEDHARKTSFGRTIVPLHLTLAPLSRIAGVIFPGEPSLYLGHEVRAAQPVFYGDTIRYSARINAVNEAHRVLTLRVLGLRGVDIVLDAEMRVQATEESWPSESGHPILHTAQPGRALVTGATGAIGGAVACALAARGWSLLLQDRGDASRRQALSELLGRSAVNVQFVAADLETSAGRVDLAKAASDLGDIEALVHAASPGLHAPLDQLVAVNYLALKELAEALVPTMLARQKGRLLFIGSTAMVRGLPGWEDYAAAKTMSAGLLGGLDGRFSAFGVRAQLLMPGYVVSDFSVDVRGDAPALLPQEVAQEVVAMIDAPAASAVVLEVGKRLLGHFGFSHTLARAPEPQPSAEGPLAVQPLSRAGGTEIDDIVRKALHLPAAVELAGGGVGETSGWDSLRQIEVILALEAGLNIRFSSVELAELGNFDQLKAVSLQKMSEK